MGAVVDPPSSCEASSFNSLTRPAYFAGAILHGIHNVAFAVGRAQSAHVLGQLKIVGGSREAVACETVACETVACETVACETPGGSA
jgi:hypothetical protein